MPRKNVPHEVDELADKLRQDDSFYPGRSQEDRTGLAYAIAWKQYNKKHPKSKKKAGSQEPLIKLSALADYLDECGLEHYAAELTDMMYRLSEEFSEEGPTEEDTAFKVNPDFNEHFEIKIKTDSKTGFAPQAVIYDKGRKECLGTDGTYGYHKIGTAYGPEEVHDLICDYVQKLDEDHAHNSAKVSYFEIDKSKGRELQAIVKAMQNNLLPKKAKYSFASICEHGLPLELWSQGSGCKLVRTAEGIVAEIADTESLRFTEGQDGFPQLIVKK